LPGNVVIPHRHWRHRYAGRTKANTSAPISGSIGQLRSRSQAGQPNAKDAKRHWYARRQGEGDMKAEWSDAPNYVRRRPHKGAVAWLIPGLIGTVIMLAALQMVSSAFLKGTAQGIVDRRIQSKPAPVAEIIRAESAATRDWDRVVEEVAARGATPQPQSAQPQASSAVPLPKQTVFNDKNYVPQGAANIVPAVRAMPERTATISNTRKDIVVVGRETRTRDYCPYREGSIERRNCKMQVDLSR